MTDALVAEVWTEKRTFYVINPCGYSPQPGGESVLTIPDDATLARAICNFAFIRGTDRESGRPVMIPSAHIIAVILRDGFD